MKKCLIVVDYQVDFVSGSLGFPGAELLAPVIENKIKDYLKDGNDVLYTMDTHAENYLSTQEGKNLPVEHCIRGSEGWKIVPSVDELQKEKVIFEKPTFPSLELGNYLKGKDYEEIELCGLVSNICVVSNAVIAKAACPEARIVIDASATDSFDKALQEKCFDVLEGLQVRVVNRNGK